eukprot:CAMPEP_0205804186 /NCGR_PEP_ID=MMETSP0205-20121125/7006_1 /ASSEMBLY_ACC=CAM_ASM_000278 /TAXON_ID=36767 /ORGANISM="Euplotes focardii, Strain TN1" /LENGTH=204 /DNA_ID=CAMNT_0053073345 /DNA_START=91 /DNA_END=702 /DNA_ORIENTATION=+
MKTDPKNSDYVCEFGATRNYEPWRDQRSAETAMAATKKFEESNDIMKSLENKTYDSKREMEILDNLEEVRHLNRRHANVNHEQMIESKRKIALKSLQEDVLKKDAKEQFNKLRRNRDEMMEQEAAQAQTKEDDSSDEEDVLGISNINKRQQKSLMKPNPITQNKFKRPFLKVVAKPKTNLTNELKSITKTSVPANPLDMYAGTG